MNGAIERLQKALPHFISWEKRIRSMNPDGENSPRQKTLIEEQRTLEEKIRQTYIADKVSFWHSILKKDLGLEDKDTGERLTATLGVFRITVPGSIPNHEVYNKINTTYQEIPVDPYGVLQNYTTLHFATARDFVQGIKIYLAANKRFEKFKRKESKAMEKVLLDAANLKRAVAHKSP